MLSIDKNIKTVKQFYEYNLSTLMNIKGYMEEDAKNTAIDTTILKIIASIAESTSIFPNRLSIKEATRIIISLPSHIDMSDQNYAYIACDYLKEGLPSKEHIRAIGTQESKRANEIALQIINHWNPPVTITYNGSYIYYTDNECRFINAIAPILLSRDFKDIQSDILRAWGIEINAVYDNDAYRQGRILETVTAAYNTGKGHIHVTELDTGKNSVIGISEESA